MYKNENKRDISIELARIIGCLIVVGCHTYLPFIENGKYDSSRLYIAMLFADGVAIFWLISGAFFDSKLNIHKIVNFIRKIYFPMLFVGCCHIVYHLLLTQTLSKDMIIHSIKQIGKNLLIWRNGIDGYGHSWYVYIYGLLIISTPVIYGILEQFDKSKRTRKIFLLFVFIFFVLNDISRNELASFSHVMFGGLVPAILITIIGKILYRYKKSFGKVCLFGSVLLFFIGNILRVFVMVYQGYSFSMLYWFTSFGVISAVCIMIICFSIVNEYSTFFDKYRSIILVISKDTFLIYLIHMLVYRILIDIGIQSSLQHMILGFNNGIVGEMTYVICITIVVVVLSVLIIFSYRYLKRFIRNKLKLVSSDKFSVRER